MNDFDVPLSFWTIGYATYLDGPAGHKKSQATMNAFLYQHFENLYTKVLSELSRVLKYPAKLYSEYNYPGFHIYRGNPALPLGLYCGGTIHYDTPHKRADFPFDTPDDKVLSFTLPLSLPKNGGGLNYWPEVPSHLSAGAWFHQSTSEMQKWLLDNVTHLDYKEGELVIHDCNILHQMSNQVQTTVDDWRITLQGHGIFMGDHWFIYF